jgi:hypothetical protein
MCMCVCVCMCVCDSSQLSMLQPHTKPTQSVDDERKVSMMKSMMNAKCRCKCAFCKCVCCICACKREPAGEHCWGHIPTPRNTQGHEFNARSSCSMCVCCACACRCDLAGGRLVYCWAHTPSLRSVVHWFAESLRCFWWANWVIILIVIIISQGMGLNYIRFTWGPSGRLFGWSACDCFCQSIICPWARTQKKGGMRKLTTENVAYGNCVQKGWRGEKNYGKWWCFW